jgi:hypothetical protein
MIRNHTLLLVLIIFSTQAFCQQKISCTVIDFDTRKPVQYVSVMLQKGRGLITDSLGRFSLTISKSELLIDSVTFSAVGYGILKMPATDMIGTDKIFLRHNAKILGEVMVFASLKGDYRRFGYYRSWNVENDGGEIGYVFWMPRTKIQVGQVQVKVNHNYDTCWLKLHLRDVPLSGLALPENELLKKNVVIATTTKYGLVEFDLNWESVSLPNNQLYIGFELLKCGCSTSTAPSFFYMGNEEGENFYRDADKTEWKRSTDYTIYVRMFSK